MKKVFLLSLFILGFYQFLFCANEIYQNYGSYYDIQTSTSIAITVSSSTYTTIPAINNGVSRKFKIIGTTTNSLYFQLGGSTSTITSNGLDLEPHTYYVENDYFGTIYFQSTGGNVNLRYQVLKKQ